MHTPHTYTTPFQVPCSLSGYLLSLFRTVRKGLMRSNYCLQRGDGITYHRSIWELSSETFAQFAWALGLEPVSNLTPQNTIPNFANRVTGSDATQHNTTHILIRLLFLLWGFGPLFSLFWNLQGPVQPYWSAKFAKNFGQVPYAKFAKYLISRRDHFEIFCEFRVWDLSKTHECVKILRMEWSAKFNPLKVWYRNCYFDRHGYYFITCLLLSYTFLKI